MDAAAVQMWHLKSLSSATHPGVYAEMKERRQ